SAAAMAVAANFFVFFILSHPLKFGCCFCIFGSCCLHRSEQHTHPDFVWIEKIEKFFKKRPDGSVSSLYIKCRTFFTSSRFVHVTLKKRTVL
ncbi:hypothetical protein, partial [Exiguobacterium artemiae]